MYVQPNSTIILYSGMPLDATYANTLYFSSRESQTDFFMNTNYKKRTFTQNTYQRVNKGQFEAQCLADDIYDCNYMAFQNTNYGNKWFYAFIKSIEYVNNGNALVSFDIDVMQTYFFDVDIKRCFVEREHSSTDNVGDNILPEPVSLAEHTFTSRTQIGTNADYSMDTVIQYAQVDPNNGNIIAVDGSIWGNVYTGTSMIAWDNTDLNDINQFLQDNIARPDAILAIYSCPHWISQGTPRGRTMDGVIHTADTTRSELLFTRSIAADSVVDGYNIKNKKLLTYPYTFLMIDNGVGQTLPLRFEYFESNEIWVHWYATMTQPVQLVLMPEFYKGTRTLGNPNEKISIVGYPQGGWVCDRYANWIGQNSVPLLIRGAASVLGSAYSGAHANSMGKGAASAGMSYMGFATETLTDAYTASIGADLARGDFYVGNAMMANNIAKFYYQTAHLPVNVIKTIDDFFDRFGYTTNRVKYPNINVRPHWTYTKTNGCIATGECPADDIVKICAIYDSGITFWKNASEVGNYNLDNTI